jgi:hypothetical protein
MSLDEVDFISLLNTFSCTMALALTQPLTEMSTRTLPGGVKGGWRVRLTTLLPSVSQLSKKMWEPCCLITLYWTDLVILYIQVSIEGGYSSLLYPVLYKTFCCRHNVYLSEIEASSF